MDGTFEIAGQDVPKKGALCGVCVLMVIIPLVVCLALSFTALDQLDYGIDYNTISLTIDGTYNSPGLYFLGLGHVFIKYPTVVQTIALGSARGAAAQSVDNWQPLDKLSTRTSDGLPMDLSCSFQYRYDFPQLKQLFLTFDQEEREVYEYTASAVIANVATNYSAYDFFNNKEGIALAMQVELAKVFATQLFARVESFQISRVELPSVFQAAILESIAVKQNTTTSQRYKDNMEVTFQSQLLVAEAEKNQTIITAEGSANRRMQEAEANSMIVTQTVNAEIYAYGAVNSGIGLSPAEGLNYQWWDTNTQYISQETKGALKDFVVGMNPNTYIAGK